jgi:hypothetical protein
VRRARGLNDGVTAMDDAPIDDGTMPDAEEDALLTALSARLDAAEYREAEAGWHADVRLLEKAGERGRAEAIDPAA